MSSRIPRPPSLDLEAIKFGVLALGVLALMAGVALFLIQNDLTIVVRIALGVCFFFVRGRAPAKRHIASLGAVREYRDLAEGSPLNRAAVLLVQQFAHALLRRGIVLQQDEIGDRTDDAVPGEVPCPGRRRNH